MSVKTTLRPVKVTASGIRTGVDIQCNDGSSAWLEIYAKPCSPITFELRMRDYDGVKYLLHWRDSLPIAHNFDLENILHVGALSGWIKEHGHKVSWPVKNDTGMLVD
jgi:hypothetical protein